MMPSSECVLSWPLVVSIHYGPKATNLRWWSSTVSGLG